MSKFQITKATKEQARARVALIGPSGAGKTYTALALASGLGGRIVVLDSEHGSSTKYADAFAFDVLKLPDFAPQTYSEAIQFVQNGYDIIVVDSLSHAWMGKGGALAQVDRLGGKFSDWAKVTPHHLNLIDTILGCSAHVIATMRSKTEYVVETYSESGRTKTMPRKVGLAPVQRDGMEYEFDIVCELDIEHNLTVTKTRCFSLDGVVVNRPTSELGKTIGAWLSDGEVAPATPDAAVVGLEAIEEIPAPPKSPREQAIETAWQLISDLGEQLEASPYLSPADIFAAVKALELKMSDNKSDLFFALVARAKSEDETASELPF